MFNLGGMAEWITVCGTQCNLNGVKWANHFNHSGVLTEYGGMAEWLKAAVLKTVRDESPSRVRISLPPQKQKYLDSFQIFLFISLFN